MKSPAKPVGRGHFSVPHETDARFLATKASWHLVHFLLELPVGSQRIGVTGRFDFSASVPRPRGSSKDNRVVRGNSQVLFYFRGDLPTSERVVVTMTARPSTIADTKSKAAGAERRYRRTARYFFGATPSCAIIFLN